MFGKVYLGVHTPTQEKVAVKILDMAKIDDDWARIRVTREIKIMKRIRHPHVITMYEVVERGSAHNMEVIVIMEYASHGELFNYIVSHQRVKESRALLFFRQIICGLEGLHSVRVAHRDLKPENLLLDQDDNVKIADFGLSNVYDNEDRLKTACGSPCYASPEMIEGQEYVPSAADIWSCGVVLYAIICGFLPFEEDTTPLLYTKIKLGHFDIPPFVSPTAINLIQRMLVVDPEKRISFDEIKKHRWYLGHVGPMFNTPMPQFDSRWGCNVPSCYACKTSAIDESIVEKLVAMGSSRESVIDSITNRIQNQLTTTYFLLHAKKVREGHKPVKASPPISPRPVGELTKPLRRIAPALIPPITLLATAQTPNVRLRARVPSIALPIPGLHSSVNTPAPATDRTSSPATGATEGAIGLALSLTNVGCPHVHDVTRPVSPVAHVLGVHNGGDDAYHDVTRPVSPTVHGTLIARGALSMLPMNGTPSGSPYLQDITRPVSPTAHGALITRGALSIVPNDTNGSPFHDVTRPVSPVGPGALLTRRTLSLLPNLGSPDDSPSAHDVTRPVSPIFGSIQSAKALLLDDAKTVRNPPVVSLATPPGSPKISSDTEQLQVQDRPGPWVPRLRPFVSAPGRQSPMRFQSAPVAARRPIFGQVTQFSQRMEQTPLPCTQASPRACTPPLRSSLSPRQLTVHQETVTPRHPRPERARREGSGIIICIPRLQWRDWREMERPRICQVTAAYPRVKPSGAVPPIVTATTIPRFSSARFSLPSTLTPGTSSVCHPSPGVNVCPNPVGMSQPANTAPSSSTIHHSAPSSSTIHHSAPSSSTVHQSARSASHTVPNSAVGANRNIPRVNPPDEPAPSTRTTTKEAGGTSVFATPQSAVFRRTSPLWIHGDNTGTDTTITLANDATVSQDGPSATRVDKRPAVPPLHLLMRNTPLIPAPEMAVKTPMQPLLTARQPPPTRPVTRVPFTSRGPRQSPTTRAPLAFTPLTRPVWNAGQREVTYDGPHGQQTTFAEIQKLLEEFGIEFTSQGFALRCAPQLGVVDVEVVPHGCKSRVKLALSRGDAGLFSSFAVWLKSQLELENVTV